ncbi:MAG: EpsG family protein [Clostridia bacterium]|nr:EpsG family protein [Clostridia bacterium]
MPIREILYTLICFSLIWAALKKRDSKVLFNIIMFFCWIVIALSMDSHDINNYRWAYDQGILRGKDKLFDLLQDLFFNSGSPFFVFKLFYSTIIWLLLYRVFRTYTVDTALAAAIFVMGPMVGLGTQMRSSMAGAIILNALPFLLEKRSKEWIYCILVLIASLFHAMALFYLVFLIPKLIHIDSSEFRDYMVVLALALIPFFLLFAKPISQILTAMQTISNISAINSLLSRLARYFSGEMSPNIKGFLFASGGHFVTFFLTDRLCETMLATRRRETQIHSHFHQDAYAIRYLHMLNSIMVLIIPCYILSMQFDRFFGYFAPVCYCLIVQGVKELKSNRLTAREYTSRHCRLLIQGIHVAHPSRNASLMGFLALLTMISCLVFCFFVNNWYSGFSEFSRIVKGIGLLNGP